MAGQLLAPALDGAVSSESRLLELRARALLALLDYCRGRWTGLGGTVAALGEELTGFASAREADVVTGCLALAYGDTGQARDQLGDVAGRLEATRCFVLLPFAVVPLARLAVATGEIDDAAGWVDRLLAGVESTGLWAPAARALPAAAHLLVAAGQQARVQDLVRRAAGELRGLDAPLAPAALRHAQGILAAGARHWPQAASSLAAAAGQYDQLGCPYEAAQAREQAAAAMLEAGTGPAGETVRAALATYERLGASWDAARCARAARSHGLRCPVPARGGRRGYGDSLSPREEQIARLAATGRSDKEIAAQLFLSPRTVRNHLDRAMRKLGVHKRAAVAARLDPG
jgi:DNA-binding CsgD family transcriptional regulator